MASTFPELRQFITVFRAFIRMLWYVGVTMWFSLLVDIVIVLLVGFFKC